MQRRKFIKNTIKGLSISPTLISAACKKENLHPNGKTVLVIGAGISGLIAAKRLKENGFNVKVLEAQDKVGGRLRTDRSLGIGFDEGASWVHGIDGNPITTLAKSAGMETFHTVDESRISYDMDGTLRSASIYDKAEEELYAILDTMMTKGNSTKSFRNVFSNLYPSKMLDRLWKFLLSTYVTFDCGDLEKVSSLLYNEGEEFQGIETMAVNGYDTIANYLAKDIDVKLNQRVSQIDYSRGNIKISHNEEISEADYVIVTVPLGVLKANAIQFVPKLPDQKQTAIDAVGMNCVNKFLLIWDTAFWDDVQYISYTPEVIDKFNYFVNIKKIHPSVNALMTFAYASYGRQTEIMVDSHIVDEIMAHLRSIYGRDIPNPTHMLRTKWQSNINSFGSYSYTAVSTEMRHFEDLAASINNKVFFAGEHTEVDYFSTVHGAYLSGIREADKIIALN